MALSTIKFKSEILRKETSIAIALPENNIILNEKLSVLYLFHGLGDDYSKWLRRSRVEEYIKQSKLIVVMPNFDKSFYTNMALGDNYWTYFIDELIPMVNKLFNVGTNRENTFIAGSSMGGFGALKTYSNTDLFNSVYSFSAITNILELFSFSKRRKYSQLDAFANPEVFNAFLKTVFGDYESLEGSSNDFLYKIKNHEKKSSLAELFLYCGTDDPLIDMNRKFHGDLLEIGIKHHYSEKKGKHDWVFWDQCLEDAIRDIVTKI